MSHALEWPSLTVQWLPEKHEHREKNVDYTSQRLILGTHTGEGEQNHLMIAEVKMPKPEAEVEGRKFENQDEYGGYAE